MLHANKVAGSRRLVVGVLGAVIGGLLGSAFFGWDVTGFNLTSVLLATLGAVVLIAIVRAVEGRGTVQRM
jgi:uncharacterized membrane protein YeaQ/YmgE (transglycosylase-associated protein family)